jgi:hypothetical protein
LTGYIISRKLFPNQPITLLYIFNKPLSEKNSSPSSSTFQKIVFSEKGSV